MRPTQQQYMYLPQPGLPHLQLPGPHGSQCGPHLQHHGFVPAAATPGMPAMGVPYARPYEYLQPGMMFQGGDPGVPAWMNLRSESRAWEAGVFGAQGRPEPSFNGGMPMVRDMVANGQGLHHVYPHPFQQPQMMTNMGILPAPHPSLPPATHNGQPGGPRWGIMPPRPGWYGGVPVPQEVYQSQGPVPEFGGGGTESGGAKGGWRGPPQTGGRGKEAGGGNAVTLSSPSKPLQGAASSEQLQCVACDRSFNSFQQKTAHTSTHVKCDVQGCNFEASTRVIREHKQSSHNNNGDPAVVPSRSSSTFSKEAEGEAQRWQDERKRNYPTAANIKRKADEAAARKSRGELVDEDARKRRERLKEILQRQLELGCPVAEVPDYILRDSYGSGVGRTQGRGPRHGGQTLNKKAPESKPAPESNRSTGTKRGLEASTDASSNNEERPTKVACVDDESQASELAEDDPVSTSVVNVAGNSQLRDTDEQDNQVHHKRQKKQGMRLCHFFLRGRCKKGTKCEFLHERTSKHLNGERREEKSQQAGSSEAKRKPSLLAKLLDPDIQREKSHILQCLRFFVNNCFLLEYSSQPLEFFSWLPSEGEAQGEPECEPSDNELAVAVEEPEQ